MEFYERLNSLLKRRNISQRKMLIDLELSESSIIDWDSGNNMPDGKILLKLSEYLDVSIDYLLGNDKYCANENDDLLIKLPCKVGETVYMISNIKSGKNWEKTIISGQIDRFIIGNLGLPLADICTEDNAWYRACAYPNDYFLALKDAQDALEKTKERK